MEQLTILVKRVLEDNSSAREDDFILINEIFSLYAPRMINFEWIVKHHKERHIPSPESITRCRRKLQEQYPELRANEVARTEKEKEMVEYSKLDKKDIDDLELVK